MLRRGSVVTLFDDAMISLTYERVTGDPTCGPAMVCGWYH
jgi:hypothetical protein